MTNYPFWLKEENTILKTQLAEKTQSQHNQIKDKDLERSRALFNLLGSLEISQFKDQGEYRQAVLETMEEFLEINLKKW